MTISSLYGEDFVISFDNVNAKDILEFKDAFSSYIVDNNRKVMIDFIISNLVQHKQFDGTGFSKIDIELFVVENFEKLLKEYMIMLRVTTREEIEKSELMASKQLKSKK